MTNTEHGVNKLLYQRIILQISLGVVITTIILFAPFITLAAAKFDIDAGVIAATTPLVNALKAHWGKGVLLSGGASALIGDGDLRQRAIRAGIGCAASGAVVLSLVAMLV